jgi:hypothetical protein
VKKKETHTIPWGQERLLLFRIALSNLLLFLRLLLSFLLRMIRMFLILLIVSLPKPIWLMSSWDTHVMVLGVVLCLGWMKIPLEILTVLPNP